MDFLKIKVLFCLLFLSFFLYLANTQEQVLETESKTVVRSSEEEQSIYDSILVSTEYDLYYWLDRLGLSAEGDKNEKQNRLIKYYDLNVASLTTVNEENIPIQEEYKVISDENDDIKVEEKLELAKGTVDEIIIQKAQKANYFTFSQVEEDVFTLIGDVEIIINDNDEGKQYKIHTDKLIYNETLRRGTAIGNVLFEESKISGSSTNASEGSSTQTFTGEVIVFDIDEFSSDILIGGTTNSKSIDYGKDRKLKSNLLFSLYAPRISKSADDVIVLQSPTITTSKFNPPIYTIALKKMWLLAPNEWSISNAVIFLGHIPVMWIPFFFNLEDKFFFNPAIGISSRNGFFLNTTTYIIGEKEKENEEDAFLDFFDFGQEQQQKKVIKGLYLRDAEAGDTITSYPNNWFLRFIFDYYTLLGAHTALTGDFKKLGFIDSLKFDLGLGLTQTIFAQTGTQNYFTYFYDENGKFATNLDHGYFLQFRLPFRYNIDLKTKLSYKSIVTQEFKFQHYSDSYFLRDFSVRQLDFSWQQILDPNYDREKLNTRSSQTSSYFWQSSTNVSIPLDSDIFGDYIQNVKLSSLLFQVNWSRKKTESDSKPYAYTAGPGSVDEEIEGYFFYPSRFYVPSYKFDVKGVLFDYGSLKGQEIGSTEEEELDAEVDQNNGIEGLEVFTLFDKEKELSSSSDEEEAYLNTIPLLEINNTSSNTLDFASVSGDLNYSLKHSLSEIIYVNTKDKNKAEDYVFLADSFVDYGILTTDNSFTLKNNLNFLANIIKIENSLLIDLKYKFLNTEKNVLESASERLVKSNDSYLREDVLTENKFSIFFLKPVQYFQSSVLSYTSSFYIARNLFSTLKDQELVEFDDKKWWKKHNTTASIVFNYSFIKQSLGFTYELPPLDELITFTYKLSVLYASFDTSLAFVKKNDQTDQTEQTNQTDQTDQTFKINPWKSKLELYYFDKKLLFTQNQTYNVEGDYWEKVQSNLRVWWLTTSFLMEYDNVYELNRSMAKFEVVGEKDLRPKSLSAKLSYTFDNAFWKDRIQTKFTINTSYTHDFLRFINSKFLLSYKLSFIIHEILAINLSVKIKNESVFSYFDIYAQQVGLDGPRSLWDDIINGFTFWDQNALYDSEFKLESINVGVLQDFGAWVLNFSYVGTPKLTGTGLQRNYKWESLVEISVLWKPLPEFVSYTYYRDDEWSLEEAIK